MKKYSFFFLCLFLLFLLFWFCCRTKTKEHFYTLFTPFHREKAAIPTINTLALNPQALQKWNVRHKELTLAYQEQHRFLINILTKLLLSRSLLLNIRLSAREFPERTIRLLHQNKLDLAAVPAPLLERGYQGKLLGSENEKMTNLRFVANLQHHFLFCITTLEAGILTVHELSGKRVGVPLHLLSIWMDIEKLLYPNGHQINFVYENDEHLFSQLEKNKIDAFFYAGTYPSEFLSGIVYHTLRHRFKFLPIISENMEAFVENNKQYRLAIISLTHEYLPSRYLPTARGRLHNTLYTANFATLSFDLTLASTDKLDPFTGYELAKTIFGGRNILSRQGQSGLDPEVDFVKHHPLSMADISAPTTPSLPVQKGARTFYYQKGMISDCQEPGCMGVIGRKRCQLCDPGVLRTELQWKSVLRKEKELKDGCVVKADKVLERDG